MITASTAAPMSLRAIYLGPSLDDALPEHRKLAASGITLTPADIGADAISAVALAPADLILVDAAHDVSLARLAIPALRRDAALEFVPIVALTPAGDTPLLERILAAGADDFIELPASAAVVAKRLSCLARGVRARRDAWNLLASRTRHAHRMARLAYWEWDRATDRFVWSPEARDLLGVASDGPLTLEALFSRMPEDDRERVRAAFFDVLANGGSVEEEFRLITKDGATRHFAGMMESMRDVTGQRLFARGAAQDITARKRAEERMRHLALHDSLTGLPNRQHLRESLEAIIAQARRYKRQSAVLFLDLNGFKRINDTLGHARGDDALRHTAMRLAEAVRAGDVLGRLGGDEFCVVLSEIASPDDAVLAAQRLIQMVREPMVLDGVETRLGVSIGITLFPEHGEDADTLLANADLAMYRAKDDGNIAFRFYSADLMHGASARLKLEADLFHALEREQFRLHYQVLKSLTDNAPVGVEVLLRWQHPQRGLLTADQFIGLAESTGLVISIGEWVLDSACRQAVRWREAGLPLLPISINVSQLSFRDPHFIDQVASALERTGMQAKWLRFDVSENAFVRNIEASLATIARLNELGVCVAIDDFGSGFGPLLQLKRLPVGALKIDKAFVHGIGESPNAAATAGAIIALGRNLGIPVVAEGVENRSQLEFLYAQGCDVVQGYAVGVPADADAIESLLRGAAASSAAHSRVD